MNVYQKRKQELRDQAAEWQLDFEKSSLFLDGAWILAELFPGIRQTVWIA